jgi:hypothetical protein
MDEVVAKILREPFPPEHIGKLPRVWCKACRDAQFKVCQQHTKRKCRDCGNNITDAHLHLDYVGHAEITDRLLQADPEWTWEPVAFSPDGLPQVDRNGGLWIRLTVAGVTRLGYGHADGKPGPDAVKEAIGDALRNAAMRFGVALDLWGAKFKDGTEEQHDDRPADDWETAKPAGDEQKKLFDDYRSRIDAAGSEQDIANVGELVRDARGAEKLTKNQYAALAKRAATRLAAIKGVAA